MNIIHRKTGVMYHEVHTYRLLHKWAFSPTLSIKLTWTRNNHLMKEMKKITRDLSTTEFSFKYTESGGITNRYLLISYIHSHFIYIYILLTEALAIGMGF
jgi:hypothetical protein